MKTGCSKSSALRVAASFVLLVSIAPLSASAGGCRVTEYSIPTDLSYPRNIVLGPDGNLWFTESLGNKIGWMTPGGVFNERDVTPGSQVDGITVGPDRALWFTEVNGNRIGRITTDGVVSEYSLPPGRSPMGITAGPDGNLWFAEYSAGKIGRMNTAGIVTGEFDIGDAFSFPSGIVVGADGNLWFTELLGNKIGRINIFGVVTGEFTSPTLRQPNGIAAGPDGNLWFTEVVGNRIGKINTAGEITEFPIPTSDSFSLVIAAGPDGNLWFTERDAGKIGHITPAGTFGSECSVPFSGPYGITAGAGGLWFTENFGNRIGHIAVDRSIITEFAIPTADSGPMGIVAGPDENLWFTEFSGNQIGEITPAGVITEFPVCLPEFCPCLYPLCDPGPRGITRAEPNLLAFTEFLGNKIGFIGADGILVAERDIPTLGSLPFGILWDVESVYFVEAFGSKLGKARLFDPHVTEYVIPASESGPLGITRGPEFPEAYLWFTEAGFDIRQIGRLNPSTGQIDEYPIAGTPQQITLGPDQNLWFTEVASGGADKIARVAADGSVTGEFALPTPNSQPFGITRRGTNEVWFTEIGGNKIGRIKLDSLLITEFPIPTPDAQPFHIEVGPDGNIWFTEFRGNKIGRLVPPP